MSFTEISKTMQIVPRPDADAECDEADAEVAAIDAELQTIMKALAQKLKLQYVSFTTRRRKYGPGLLIRVPANPIAATGPRRKVVRIYTSCRSRRGLRSR